MTFPKTHGEGWPNYSPEYISWKKMKQRCLREGEINFHNYGGRGIKVHPAFEKFEGFLEYMGRKPTPEHSVDRIDVNGDYEPGNVRWASRKEQAANRRPRTKRATNA